MPKGFISYETPLIRDPTGRISENCVYRGAEDHRKGLSGLAGGFHVSDALIAFVGERCHACQLLEHFIEVRRAFKAANRRDPVHIFVRSHQQFLGVDNPLRNDIIGYVHSCQLNQRKGAAVE